MSMTYQDTSVAAASDELVRLANEGKRVPALEAEIERLRADLTREQGQRLCDNMKSVEENERLRAALQAAKLPHYVCDEDCWYSCPKSGQSCRDGRDSTKCDCGADAHNAKIDSALGDEQRVSDEH